jgi:hypothetical protein
MRFMKHNWLYLSLLVIAVAIYSFGVTPWLWENGHRGLSLTGYGIFALLVVYGRANRMKPRPSDSTDNKQGTQRLRGGREA